MGRPFKCNDSVASLAASPCFSVVDFGYDHLWLHANPLDLSLSATHKEKKEHV
jgi:hypothetical protein